MLLLEKLDLLRSDLVTDGVEDFVNHEISRLVNPVMDGTELLVQLMFEIGKLLVDELLNCQSVLVARIRWCRNEAASTDNMWGPHLAILIGFVFAE